MRTITNRDMQNPDEPNLPFAQSFPIHGEAPIPINFGQSLALSSLARPNPQHTRYEYIVNGQETGFPYFKPKMVNAKHFWTESQA